MYTFRYWILLVLAVLLLTGTAAAEGSDTDSETQEHMHQQIKQLDMEVQKNTVISSIHCDNIQPDSVQNFTLHKFGDIYKINISSSHYGPQTEYIAGGYWTFDIDMTYPNGTTVSKELKTFHAMASDYDIHIQYIARTDSFLDIDIYLTMIPLEASFQPSTPAEGYEGTEENFTSENDRTYLMIPMNRFQVSSTDYMDLAYKTMSAQEFQEHRDDPYGETMGDLFDWTWGAVLGAASNIPFVGQYLETVLQISGMAIGEVIFWFDLLIIKNWEITALTFETVIIADSIHSTKSLPSLVRRLIDNHVKVIEFMIELINTITMVIGRIVLAISNLIQSIKPT